VTQPSQQVRVDAEGLIDRMVGLALGGWGGRVLCGVVCAPIVQPRMPRARW